MTIIDLFSGIDSLILMSIMGFFLFGLFFGMMHNSWKIALIGVLLSVATFYGGKHYLDGLEWHEKKEIIEITRWDRLEFSKPVKVEITTKYRDGCTLKPQSAKVLID